MQCLCYSWPRVSFPCLEEEACCCRAVWPLHICPVCGVTLQMPLPLLRNSRTCGLTSSLIIDGDQLGRPEPRVSTRAQLWLTCLCLESLASFVLVGESLFFFSCGTGVGFERGLWNAIYKSAWTRREKKKRLSLLSCPGVGWEVWRGGGWGTKFASVCVLAFAGFKGSIMGLMNRAYYKEFRGPWSPDSGGLGALRSQTLTCPPFPLQCPLSTSAILQEYGLAAPSHGSCLWHSGGGKAQWLVLDTMCPTAGSWQSLICRGC